MSSEGLELPLDTASKSLIEIKKRKYRKQIQTFQLCITGKAKRSAFKEWQPSIISVSYDRQKTSDSRPKQKYYRCKYILHLNEIITPFD